MSTYLLTGATGFVGTALANRLLKRGDRVVALVRDGNAPSRCEVIRGELEDLRTCERAVNEVRPDGIFHLAAQAMVGASQRDPFGTFESNVRGTYNLLESFRRYRTPLGRMVVASSDKAYGETTEYCRMSEEGAMDGRGPYDCSKSCADLIARSYRQSYGLPIEVVRAGNIYGQSDREPSRIIPSFVTNFLCDEPLTIRSDGRPVRDYLYIDDVIDGYLRVDDYLDKSWNCLDDESFGFNLSGGQTVSVKALANIFVDIIELAAENSTSRFGSWARRWCEMTREKIVIKQSRTGDIRYQALDCSKAERVLNWMPAVDLKRGITEILEYRCNVVGP